MNLQAWLLLGTCLTFTTCSALVWLWARSEGMWSDLEAVKFRIIEEFTEAEGDVHEFERSGKP